MSVIRLENVENLVLSVEKEFKQLKAENLKKLNPSPYGEGEGNDQFDLMSVFKSADADTSELGVAIEFSIYYKRSLVENKYCGIALYLPLYRHSDYEAVRKNLIELSYPSQYIAVLDLFNTVTKN